MNVLIACEFSAVVRDAFRSRGHNAWSCDLLPTEGDDDYHYQCDIRRVLGLGWDLMIAHPPCTYLCVSGLHWNNRIEGRREKTEEALGFVRLLLNAPVERIALENPVGAISRHVRRPDQIIQPYEYGHSESKLTCFWLKNLPKLQPTNILKPTRFQTNGKPRWDNQTPTGQNKLGPSATRAMERARTYKGIAEAMAEQWGRL